MDKDKILFIFSLIFILMFFIGSVSANDAGSDVYQEIQDTDSNDLNFDENQVIGSDFEGDNNPTGNFTQLAQDINTGGSLIQLTRNYTMGDGETHVEISRNNIIIDGQGHTLNANGLGNIFGVTGTNITFKNIIFINGNSVNGGAIGDFYGSDKYYTVIGCTFINNTVSNCGGALYSNKNPIYVYNSTFINNRNTAGYGGGAIFSDRNIYVYNSNFYGNSIARSAGSAIKSSGGLVSVVNSNFAGPQSGSKIPGYVTASSFNGNNNTLSYTDLNTLISSNTIIDLEYNYKYFPEYDSDYVNGFALSNDIVIDGHGHSIDAVNIAKIFRVSGNNVTFKNLILINGLGGNGVAIGEFYGSGKYYTVINCTFINNTATNCGGALYSNSNPIYIYDSTFINNHNLGGYGGGAIFSDMDIYVDGSSFYNNGVVNAGGGAIRSNRGLVSVSNSIFYNNTANPLGGAIRAVKAIVENCTFTSNNATSDGGAIKADLIHITTSSFINNTAKSRGGAINGVNITIEDCIFTNNSAASDGGAVYGPIQKLTGSNFKNNIGFNGGAIAFTSINNTIITNCNFTNNSAHHGGSIYLDNVNFTISNCNFINSYASNIGGAIHAWWGNHTIKDSSFINCISQYGGAIIAMNDNLTLNNLILINNTAFGFGGAIYKRFGNLSINLAEFSNSYAYYDGGAIYLSHVSAIINNTSFKNNRVTYGGGAIHSLISTLSYDDFTFSSFNSTSNINGYVETNYINSFLDLGNYTMVVANTSNYNGTLPSRFSLVENGWDTSVKNQGSMGICWDYAAIAIVETALAKATGVLYDLSEDNVKNIISRYSDYGINRNTNGGGTTWDPYGYFANAFGPVFETTDPISSFEFSPVFNNVFLVDNIGVAARPNGLDNREIKEAVIKYGGVKVGITLANAKGYNYYNPNPGTNHAVTIVGWDDNYSVDNFPENCTGDGAWIVKNSWGSGSGLNGYIYVSYYDKSIAPGPNFYIIFNNTIKYDRIYQYDYSRIQYFTSGSSTSWYKNIYTSVSNEGICAFSTYFESSINWEAFVYVNGELKHSQTGYSPGNGYYTFNFNEIIPVAKGDKIEITVKVNKNRIPFTYKDWMNTQSCGEGVSYYSKDGENWIDMDANNRAASLKLFTQRMNGSSISIQPINNVTYGNPVLINFNIENKTTINYILKNKNGDIILSANNINTNQIKLSNLAADDYTITIINENTDAYVGCNISANFTITRANSLININPINNIIYGNPINVYFNTINKTSVTYIVKTKNGTIVIDNTTVTGNTINLPILNADDYIIIIANSNNKNYTGDIKSTQFTITKAPSNVIIPTNCSVIYSNSININLILNNASSVDAYLLDSKGNSFNLSTTNNIITIDSSNLSVGNYTIQVTTITDSNHYSITSNAKFIVMPKKSSNINASTVSIVVGDVASVRVVLPVDASGSVSIGSVSAPVRNGVAVVNVSGLAVGTHSLDVVYSGDANYNGSSTVVSVVVAKRESGFVVYAHNLTKFKGSNDRFVINVIDGEGNPIANQNVTILLNGKNYYRITDNKGIAGMNINLDPGVYTPVVTVNGSSVKATIIIKSTISGNDVTKIFKNGTQYYASFKDINGNYLSDGSEVIFNINGVMYHRKVNGNQGLVRLNVNLDPGEFVLTAINPVNNEMISNIVKVLPRIIENKDLVKYYKNNSQYVIKVLDDEGNAVGANEVVKFNINGVMYYRQTDATGHVKLSINLDPGEFVITAEYKGFMISNNIEVLPLIMANDLTKKYGTSDPFRAKILDNYGNSVVKQSVNFNINGVFYQRVSDDDGIVKLNINLIPGKYIITSSFNGFGTSNMVTVLS